METTLNNKLYLRKIILSILNKLPWRRYFMRYDNFNASVYCPEEAMLLSLGSLIEDNAFTAFPPVIGQAFEDVDKYYASLGDPIGIATYIPYHSFGEDYLHDYLGMCGTPLEPDPQYPTSAESIFLTENAAQDTNLISKIKNSLQAGANVTA
jgi:hypothetical protein